MNASSNASVPTIKIDPQTGEQFSEDMAYVAEEVTRDTITDILKEKQELRTCLCYAQDRAALLLDIINLARESVTFIDVSQKLFFAMFERIAESIVDCEKPVVPF